MLKLRPIAALILCSALVPACMTATPKQKMTATPQLNIKPYSEIRPGAGANVDNYELGKYYQETGRLGLAMEAYGKALSLNSRQLETRNALATLYSQQGRLVEAEATLREVIAQSRGVAYLHNNLGYVYFLRGNHVAAVQELRTALTLDPNHEWARNNLKLAESALERQRAENTTIPLARAATTVAAFEVWDVVNEPDLQKEGSGPTAKMERRIDLPAPTNAAPTYSKFRLEISNGNGSRGLAKRLSRTLVRQGIAVSSLTNQLPFQQMTTEIQYRDGFEQEAERLKNSLPGHAIIVRASTPLRARTDLRVVLGKDATPRIAEIGSDERALAAMSKSAAGQS